MWINFTVQFLQIIGCLVPIVGIVALFYKKQSLSSMYLILTNIGCLIMNVGYWMFLNSTVYEEAMLAYKMEYIGNTMFYLFFGLFVVSYFTKKYARQGFYIWVIFEMIPLFCLLTERLNGVLFKKITFGWHPVVGLRYMYLEPQPLYMIRYSLIAFVLLTGVVVSTIYLFKSKIQSEREIVARLIGAEFVIVISLTIKLVGNFKFDVVPLLGSLSILSIILSVIQGEFWGITEMAREWAFEQLENSVIVVDKFYRYLEANKYAMDLFPELRKHPYKAVISGNLYDMFQQDDCMMEIGDKCYELKMIELYWNNKIEGYCLLLMDVTEMRQLMEQLVEEKNRADQANKAKSMFMSNMSHEIRTPMNAIVGMTEILLRSELPEMEREYLGNIQRSGNALLGIINDILDFSKLESGKMKITEDTYAPLLMLNDLKMIILNRIGSKMLQLEYEIDENLPAKLYGDELRIRQVLINIANNAVKFTEEGYVRILVKIERIEDGIAHILFSVKDTGQGIAKEDLKKLFGVYQQVDTKKNHNKEGTGLGLAISKQFVEMMGGTLEVQSEYGKGSEFYFTIPQKIMDARKAIDVKVEIEGNILNFVAPEAKILLVDDNEMNLKVAKGLLAPLQMQIDTAENGKQALDMIGNKRYDLVFMDHMMPIMDGVEATKKIREMEEEYYKKVPIIALTANALVEARKTFREAGMNDFVAKPIEIKDICAKIKKWLKSEYIIEKKDEISDGEKSEYSEGASSGMENGSLEEQKEDLIIQGLNVAEGIRNSGTRELFVSLLGDFYKLIDMKSIKMEKCLADGLIRDYTIEVHALKNTARMIGAMELSKWCYQLEQWGNEENTELLEKETPEMLKLYRSYKEVLEPYARLQETDKQQVSKEVIIEKLSQLKNAIDAFDLDKADATMKEIESYQMEESCRTLLDELRAYMADVAMEEIMATCDKLIEVVK